MTWSNPIFKYFVYAVIGIIAISAISYWTGFYSLFE